MDRETDSAATPPLSSTAPSTSEMRGRMPVSGIDTSRAQSKEVASSGSATDRSRLPMVQADITSPAAMMPMPSSHRRRCSRSAISRRCRK